MLKKDAADEAEFVYQNKEVLSQLQQESGVQIIPQDQFIAEDKDELQATHSTHQETTDEKIKRSFFDKYIDKIKEFLDNAE